MAFIEYTDRYKAAGLAYPDPKTVCKGPCEGMGIYPEPRTRNADGTIPMNTKWDFKKCPDCDGKGER